MNLHAKLYTINIKLANCAYRVTQCYTSVNALAFLFSSIVERTCRFIIYFNRKVLTRFFFFIQIFMALEIFILVLL